MSLLFNQLSGNVQDAWLSGVVTLVFVAIFVGYAWWAWRPANKERMEAYGRLPLEDDTPGGLS